MSESETNEAAAKTKVQEIDWNFITCKRETNAQAIHNTKRRSEINDTATEDYKHWLVFNAFLV